MTDRGQDRGEPTLSTRPVWVSRGASLARSRVLRRRLAAARDYPDLPPVPRTPPREPSAPPVFVLSSGWRSGSTALQRLIVSGGTAYVWGEPFATSRLLPRLQRIAVEAPVADGLPERVPSGPRLSPEAAGSWIALTNPPPGAVLNGVRAMLQETYWGPLRETGFATWGVKEVVATPEQVRLLAAAFPEARFVCVVRDPTAAYRSFRRFVVSGVTTRPGAGTRLRWVSGPAGFSRTWVALAAAFRELRGDPRFHVFRHEDIAGDPAFADRLGERLEMTLSADAWATRVGGTRSREPGPVERAEVALVARACRAEAARWEYRV